MARFEELTREATVRLEKSGFRAVDKGSERHGAFEWSWLHERERDKAHCYVSLGVLEDTPGIYEVEVSAAADDGEHFGRVEILPLTKGAKDEDIINALEKGAEYALRMDKKDMPHSKQVSIPAR